MPQASASELPPIWPADARHGVAAGLLALAILALGLVLGHFHELGGYMVENDFYGQFYPAAQAVLHGEPMANPRSGPGYPLLLAAGSWLTHDLFFFGKVVASVSLAASGWLTFLVVRAFSTATAGIIAQCFVYAILGRYCCVVGNDLPFVALATASLFFLLRRQQTSGLDALLAGTFAGLAMALRYPGVALIPTAIVALWLWPPPATTGRRRLLTGALFALTAIVCSVPSWGAATLGLTTAKESKAYAFVALDIYADKNDRLSQTHLDDMEVRFSSMADVFTRDPRRVLSHYSTDIYEDAVRVAADSVTLPAVFFVGAGLLLWLAMGAADRRRAASFLVFPLFTFGIVALVPYQARYGYPMVPAAAGLIGAAFAHRWTTAAAHEASWRIAQRVRRCCLWLAFLPPLAMTTIKLREYVTSEPIELLTGGAALRPLVRPGDRMIARKSHLPHLAGAQFVFSKQNLALPEFLAWAKDEAKARFLLVGQWEVNTNGALRPLLAGDAPQGLRVVWQHESPRQVVYEILPQ